MNLDLVSKLMQKLVSLNCRIAFALVGYIQGVKTMAHCELLDRNEVDAPMLSDLAFG